MATLYKRKGSRGVRWTARVRKGGRQVTKTFSSKASADTWVRAQEDAIETGAFRAPDSAGTILADMIDAFLEHRRTIRRPLGKTSSAALLRIKTQHGLEAAAALTEDFWRKHALSRMKGGAASQTATQDLLYIAPVLKLAALDCAVDKDAPGAARARLKGEGLRVVSRTRERRISDDELKALLAWLDANASRTRVPIVDIVRFALATSMRRGEITSIRHEDLSGRVILVRNRKHPSDHDRVDKVPLLQPHAVWPRDDPVAIIERQPTSSGRIFPYRGAAISLWFDAAVKGAGLKNIVFHTLRHEALSRYADRGMDSLRLQLIGGHRDLKQLQRYAKLDAARLANE